MVHKCTDTHLSVQVMILSSITDKLSETFLRAYDPDIAQFSQDMESTKNKQSAIAANYTLVKMYNIHLTSPILT